MKETLIDIETYCEADIKKCGLYRYVSDPSFEILLIAWATDEGSGFGETKLTDLASGEPFPQELLDNFKDSNVTLIAHNAAFERVSFSRYLQQHYPGRYLEPGAFLSPDRWICTMVMAASLTLPMALKDVGEVLRTTQQKDEEGKRLIKLFSAPCKPTKSNGGRTRNLPYHLPEDWAKFKYYCIQDVNTEVDIYKRLKRFPMACGYGGSSGALISMGALQMGLKEEELPEIIDSWREANPKIVQYWWDVEKAAMQAFKTGERQDIGRISFAFSSGTLWMVLPSGRKLAYLKPKQQPNRFGRMSLTYEGVGQNHKWARQETYSGRLVENATQAIARDILAEAMARIEDEGLNIVAHVHDEVIIEAPKGKHTVEEICQLMAANPDWCDGLPLAAAGYKGDYYFKD